MRDCGVGVNYLNVSHVVMKRNGSQGQIRSGIVVIHQIISNSECNLGLWN